jgi:hypothetical protein
VTSFLTFFFWRSQNDSHVGTYVPLNEQASRLRTRLAFLLRVASLE